MKKLSPGAVRLKKLKFLRVLVRTLVIYKLATLGNTRIARQLLDLSYGATAYNNNNIKTEFSAKCPRKFLVSQVLCVKVQFSNISTVCGKAG